MRMRRGSYFAFILLLFSSSTLLLLLSLVESKPLVSDVAVGQVQTEIPSPSEQLSQDVEVQSNADPPNSDRESPVEVSGQRHRNVETFRYNIASEPEPESDEFADQSRRTFLSLSHQKKQQPVESSAGVPDDEERRQLWLSRHHHHQRKTGHETTTSTAGQENTGASRQEPPQRREGPLVNPKNLLTLTSGDVINQTQTCTGDLFKHKVRVTGCEPKIIINRFCHGSCTSFYIPRLRSKKLKATFQSCSVCVPSETDLVQVKLNCPDREERELYRKVMRVKKCACRSIEVEPADNDEDYDNNADAAGDLGY